jgi:hypothetical protein
VRAVTAAAAVVAVAASSPRHTKQFLTAPYRLQAKEIAFPGTGHLTYITLQKTIGTRRKAS